MIQYNQSTSSISLATHSPDLENSSDEITSSKMSFCGFHIDETCTSWLPVKRISWGKKSVKWYCAFSIQTFCSCQIPWACAPGAPNHTFHSSLGASACAWPAWAEMPRISGETDQCPSLQVQVPVQWHRLRGYWCQLLLPWPAAYSVDHQQYCHATHRHWLSVLGCQWLAGGLGLAGRPGSGARPLPRLARRGRATGTVTEFRRSWVQGRLRPYGYPASPGTQGSTTPASCSTIWELAPCIDLYRLYGYLEGSNILFKFRYLNTGI